MCFWNDDGQDDHDADEVRGGPNRGLSLTEARDNFRSFGASDERRVALVRDPLPEESPPPRAEEVPAGPKPEPSVGLLLLHRAGPASVSTAHRFAELPEGGAHFFLARPGVDLQQAAVPGGPIPSGQAAALTRCT